MRLVLRDTLQQAHLNGNTETDTRYTCYYRDLSDFPLSVLYTLAASCFTSDVNISTHGKQFSKAHLPEHCSSWLQTE